MKRFLECLVPTTQCGIHCNYCYVVQQDRDKQKIKKLPYDPEYIGRALSVERLGGVSYISLTGAGETLGPRYIVDLVYHILKQGHFVNITSNGLMSPKIKKFAEFPDTYRERLHFAFSFHYDELVRMKKIDVFFENVKRVKDFGSSFLVQVNLCEDYYENWDKIKEITLERTGALPQVAVTRDESGYPFKYFTSGSDEEYLQKGREANSPLFDFTVDNFNKKRKEFCYAGDWSGKLYLETGELHGCYGAGIKQNIFTDITKPIKFEAIGCNCNSSYCVNSSHFLSLGTIPSLNTPTYGDLRNRKEAGWYNKRMEAFLDIKLSDTNSQYNLIRKAVVNTKYFILHKSRRFADIVSENEEMPMHQRVLKK